MPKHMGYLWEHFKSLSFERPNNGFSLQRLTARVIKDWCELYLVELEAWEIRAIYQIDSAYVESQNPDKDSNEEEA